MFIVFRRVDLLFLNLSLITADKTAETIMLQEKPQKNISVDVVKFKPIKKSEIRNIIVLVSR